MISKSAGHQVDYVDMPLDEFFNRSALVGLPDNVIRHHEEVHRFLRSELASCVSLDVERVLGRSPRDFVPFVLEHAVLWKRTAA